MTTIRKQIIEVISDAQCDARDISSAVGITEKEVYGHLPHIARSLPKQGKKLKITPARCIACGYVFKDRQRVNKPSRCPRCKSERIEHPRFAAA